MMNENIPSTISPVPVRMRPLKGNERPEPGDFVEDGSGGFEAWIGPSGFRSDAFIKQIYRRQHGPRDETNKPS
jgi:hypothetical protein